jgi:hypothetical protein
MALVEKNSPEGRSGSPQSVAQLGRLPVNRRLPRRPPPAAIREPGERTLISHGANHPDVRDTLGEFGRRSPRQCCWPWDTTLAGQGPSYCSRWAAGPPTTTSSRQRVRSLPERWLPTPATMPRLLLSWALHERRLLVWNKHGAAVAGHIAPGLRVGPYRQRSQVARDSGLIGVVFVAEPLA